VPKPFPKEFRRDVIAVARQGEQSIAQVARSFGISESCLNRWLKIADREEQCLKHVDDVGGVVPSV
jgi:transposase